MEDPFYSPTCLDLYMRHCPVGGPTAARRGTATDAGGSLGAKLTHPAADLIESCAHRVPTNGQTVIAPDRVR